MGRLEGDRVFRLSSLNFPMFYMFIAKGCENTFLFSEKEEAAWELWEPGVSGGKQNGSKRAQTFQTNRIRQNRGGTVTPGPERICLNGLGAHGRYSSPPAWLDGI